MLEFDMTATLLALAVLGLQQPKTQTDRELERFKGIKKIYSLGAYITGPRSLDSKGTEERLKNILELKLRSVKIKVGDNEDKATIDSPMMYFKVDVKDFNGTVGLAQVELKVEENAILMRSDLTKHPIVAMAITYERLKPIMVHANSFEQDVAQAAEGFMDEFNNIYLRANEN